MDKNQMTLRPLTCPRCNGVLQQAADGSYHCPLGHVYTPQALITQQTAAVESALWAALRVLEEQTKVLTALATDEPATADPVLGYLLENSAALSVAYAAALRTLIASYGLPL